MARRSKRIRPGTPGALALALSLLVVAACAAPGGTARTGDGEPPPPGKQAAESSAETTPGVAALTPVAPEQTDETPSAPAQKTARRAVNDDPNQLMGLAPEAINHLLGPPSLLRTEAPAQVWQYTAAGCVLDIYLYAEEEQPDRSRVTYFEIRRGESAPSGARACFANILESRNLAAGITPES